YLYTAPRVRIRVCGSHEDEMLGALLREESPASSLLLLQLLEMSQKGKAVAVAGASRMEPEAPQETRYRFFEGLRERYRIGEEYDIVLAKKEDTYSMQRPGCIVMS
ncbi:hypothetical protein Taro_003530, partial [Colocasia esculenta]|nr:hypothetical protein [Colocasia esculenta]